ncbi:hypothetical protein B9Z55_023396 [Caenorhabditis nigoni]|uniref:Uncharacterized protein n=1 Tax=Caenorhabditis nigoni TaxID=1611254 RepID=A0A2G5SQ00_9PELO|nr:hypothetical protein B9Z55_023396 [Caenorhabditis nigoni]
MAEDYTADHDSSGDPLQKMRNKTNRFLSNVKRKADTLSGMEKTMYLQKKYIESLEDTRDFQDSYIDDDKKRIENQEWMIKFLLLELEDTIITKNKKIESWRSSALKCAPPTSKLHKFADEKEVPESDEELLGIINDVLETQETAAGATESSEYVNQSELFTDEYKAAFNYFLKKHESETEAGAGTSVE